jgi:transcriptional regulator with XRE-family HTH domain
MLHLISPAQVKAGRALLGRSGEQLAAMVGVSVTTIRNVESGEMSVRSGTMEAIRRVMEKAGIEFTESEGVRRRPEHIWILEGRDAAELLFADVVNTVRETGTAVVALLRSAGMLRDICGVRPGSLGHLESVTKYGAFKCLLTEAFEVRCEGNAAEFRRILKQHGGSHSYFVYGNKLAIVVDYGHSSFKLFVHDNFTLSHDTRLYFSLLWDAAPPVFAELKPPRDAVSA